MGIVFVTMVGEAKLAFADALNKKTNGGVDLVIVQRNRRSIIRRRFVRAQKMFKEGTLHRELWYAFLLRVSPGMRRTLAYFRESDLALDFDPKGLPKIIEVDSINTDEVHELLSKMSPDLMVVWGGKIMQPRIIATAKRAINLHIGRCPTYRGVLANQHAVLDGDFPNIGATIHHVVPEVDAGDIIEIVEPDLSKKPRDLFADLCDRAQTVCLEIAAKMHRGEEVPHSTPTGEKKGIMLLEHWTPQVRYKVAKRMYAWEQKGIHLHSKHVTISEKGGIIETVI